MVRSRLRRIPLSFTRSTKPATILLMNEQNQPGGSWQYRPSEGDQTTLTPGMDPQLQSVATGHGDGSHQSVSWSASEFIAHEKSGNWYLTLAACGVIAAALAYIFTKDVTTTIIILIAAFVFGFEGRRKPRQIQYTVTHQGITIGNKFLPFHNFRSFAIIEDGPFPTLVFLPLKRFALTATAYVDPKDADTIVDIIADRLPIEDRSHDAVDRLMRRIRF